jgi:uncharacterized protein HemX
MNPNDPVQKQSATPNQPNYQAPQAPVPTLVGSVPSAIPPSQPPIQQQVNPPVKSGRKKLLIIALILLALIIAVGCAIAFSRGKKDKQGSNSVKIPVPSSVSNKTSVTADELDNNLTNYLVNMIDKVNEYGSSNQGKLPASLDPIRTQLTESRYNDWANAGPITEGKPAKNTFYYATNYKCNNPANTLMVPYANQAAIVVLLPSGKPYCIN